MNQNIFLTKYGLNHTRLKSLLLKFGISNFNSSFLNKDKNDDIIKFLDLNLNKKEIILKKNYLLYLKQLENGSLNGYKRLRGLPSHGQRTKTNAKTNRTKK